MMLENDSQLSVFNTIKNAILANSVLNVRFRSCDVYEFEPKLKSAGFSGFPYFRIEFPELGGEKAVMDYGLEFREWSVLVHLRVEFLARSKVRDFANAFIKAVEDYVGVFESSGFYDVGVGLENVDDSLVIDQKELVEAIFRVSFHGGVRR